MRRFLASLLALVVLAACGGSSGGSQTSCESSYWDGVLGTCLPEDWVVLSEEELSLRGLPNEVLVAFQGVNSVSGQFPTITVTREPLRTDLDSTAYSKASIESVARRKDYSAVDTTNVEIDGKEVVLHIFTAQPLTEEPKQRFYQLAAVNDERGYVLTAALPLSAPDSIIREVRLILSSLTFIPPAEE